MRRQNPDGVYEPVESAYSQVVSSRAEKMVFVAGTVPKNRQGNLVGPRDMGKQIQCTVKNIETSLRSEDASMSDVVRLRTFTTDMERYLCSERIVLDYFGEEEKPASTLVSVDSLADDFEGTEKGDRTDTGTEEPGYMVEVDATAVVG